MSEADKAKAELQRCLADPLWRISNLYKIIIKGDDDEEGLVVQFKPNRAQRRFIERLHHRNIILKARQLGFTTLIAIVWLDHALFNANSRCGIIAHDRDAAKVIFRDKVKFAYENLPADLREAMPLKADNADELLFAHNNSSVRVATSMRSGTLHRLHISEFGKICARYPDKAREVVTGSIPAVPKNGITVIESTAEGAEGEFHDMTQRAIALKEQGKALTPKEWRFHFFPWWDEQQYRLPEGSATITEKDTEYFAEVEAKMETTLDTEQRAWYVATRDTDFAGSDERMWQEYPSTPQEAFQVSTDGCYYSKQVTAVRKQGRLLRIPTINQPVNTFWDIGRSDGTAIWFHQQVGMEDRFIKYEEAHGEDLHYFVKLLQDTGYVFNKHFLPHDADHKRLSDTNKSTKEMLEGLGLRNIEIVPVISDINTGINITRSHFPTAYFDENGCKLGFAHLENYKKKWNERDGRWSDEPRKDKTSEGCDAFRQWAQAKELGMITPAGSWGSTLSYKAMGYA
jgi:hypothetical protein